MKKINISTPLYTIIKVWRPASGADVQKMIPSEDEEKPDDWDDDEDGVWSPPMVRAV